MKTSYPLLLLLLAGFALPLAGDDWSASVGTGPFVFGHFVERTIRAGTGEGGATSVSHLVMSARTRPGLSVDVERGFADRWAVRAEAAITESPIAIKSGGSGVALDAGKIDVTTFMAPLLFRINPNGAIRFHLLGGPACAVYHVRRRAPASQIAVFEGTRGRWGLAVGGGADWWWSQRFAVEGEITDIASASPFSRADFGASQLIRIPRTHNVHSTIGIRWKF